MTGPITTCPGCGQQPPPGIRFCPGCGLAVQTGSGSGYLPPVPPPMRPEPPIPHGAPLTGERPPLPPRNNSRPLALVLISAAAIAVIAVAVVFVVQRSGSTGGRGEAAAVVVASRTTAPGTEPPATTTTEQPTTTVQSHADAERAAQEALDRQVATDQPSVEQLADTWVPELSSKKVGLHANGVTYDYLAIWADYQQQVAAHPDALLLKSGDFSTFRFGDFWVTVVPQTFGAAAPANAWCDSQGIAPNDCYAKRLSHTLGYLGSSVTRN